MAKKILIPDGTGGVQKQAKSTYKAKVAKYVQPKSITEYLLKRDRVLYRICGDDVKEYLKEKYGKQ